MVLLIFVRKIVLRLIVLFFKYLNGLELIILYIWLYNFVILYVFFNLSFGGFIRMLRYLKVDILRGLY